MHDWGMKLSEYLESRGLTDAAFAALVGRDRTSVTRWRNGTTRPDLDALLAVYVATGGLVTPNDFLIPANMDSAEAVE